MIYSALPKCRPCFRYFIKFSSVLAPTLFTDSSDALDKMTHIYCRPALRRWTLWLLSGQETLQAVSGINCTGSATNIGKRRLIVLCTSCQKTDLGSQ